MSSANTLQLQEVTMHLLAWFALLNLLMKWTRFE